ncbi:MAG: helix-turn-helix domain-containing protein [Blastocatellia bacterium]|nr:helix-turn-helix domain-containing protein [Blastocatellia bacterium]HMZ79157.1 helix-turn-helix domain-containing protein [Acidobacteriota bacterium]
MTPAFIKFQLEERGESVSKIALDCDCSISFVSQVIRRKKKSERVESEICRVLGRPRSEVFPDQGATVATICQLPSNPATLAALVSLAKAGASALETIDF